MLASFEPPHGYNIFCLSANVFGKEPRLAAAVLLRQEPDEEADEDDGKEKENDDGDDTTDDGYLE
jgi:hypothetical protein